MAVYKVIQDVEADDKLVGPLTLKQFIFAGIAAGFTFAAVMVATRLSIYGAIPFVPFIVIPAALAAPLGKDQPTEVWLAAQIRFLIKPHKRLWDQNGIKELVTITVPKRVEKILTKGFGQEEAKSRLKMLATAIDNRSYSFAEESIPAQAYNVPAMDEESGERLVGISSLPVIAPALNVSNSDDIMDTENNALARRIDQLAQQAKDQQRQNIISNVRADKPEEKIDNPENDDLNIHIAKTMTPTSQQNDGKISPQDQQAQAVTPPKNPDIVRLSQTNDLKISTIAGLANRKSNDGEVVISLH